LSGPSRLIGVGLLLVLGSTAARAERVSFQRSILPILSNRCFRCHGPDEESRQGDLRLDRREDAVAAAIVPRYPDRSELVRRITSSDPDERMPPKKGGGKRLADHQIELLQAWIRQGAPYERHWSLVPPQRPELPAVRHAAWPAGPLDTFILARLEDEGWLPSRDADRTTLARRLYFDLVGLPPTVEQIDVFLADDRPDAYVRLADRLIASPHFGERMAIYWLDLVRYAESVGYHGDQEQAITPYRDYVIDSFNRDIGFDRFTIEQLAGDLLPDATDRTRIASGYNRVLQTSHEGGIQRKEYLAKYAADRVRNLSSVWMAATLACAECHDHKYDPYTQRDFYRLAAFFADVDDRGTFHGSDTTPTQREPEMVVAMAWDRAELARLRQRIEPLEAKIAAGAVSEVARSRCQRELDDVRRRVAEIEKRGRRTMITVAVEPRTVRVLHRGDWMDESGEIVRPGVPACLKQIATAGRRATRLDLAQWLTSADHPQTSRVLANRLWYLFFGSGISKTLDDLGSQGEWPVHPKLLDWMAVELVDRDWHIKHLVRQIVLSHTYRQISLASSELQQRDPHNRLLARQSRFRLPAEMVRDMALSVSGLLVGQVGGASARPYQPAGYYAHLNFPTRTYHPDHGANQYRRGVYTHWQRQFLHPMLKAFDAPSREQCTARRPTSNTPQAALVLLNDPTFVEAARVFAERIVTAGGSDRADRIAWAWRQVLSRGPDADEQSMLADFYAENLRNFQADRQAADQLLTTGDSPVAPGWDRVELAAWTEVARALLNLSESITRN